jgi:hypothetical protein
VITDRLPGITPTQPSPIKGEDFIILIMSLPLDGGGEVGVKVYPEKRDSNNKI